MKIYGLDTSNAYDLNLFASRLATDNRETAYHIQASNKDTIVFLDASDNTSNIVTAPQLVPLDDGTIIVNATTGPNNDNEFGFFYLGVLQLSFEDRFEPVPATLTLTSPTGGEYWQSGKRPEIRWRSQGITSVILEYSIDNGIQWIPIDTTSALEQRYTWTVPAITSSDCLIRIVSDTLSNQSLSPFEITNQDTTECHIVVLGSSTAAGTGPTSVDSAWVWTVSYTHLTLPTKA